MPKRYSETYNDCSSDSEEDLCERGQYLKDNFTLDDFLEFDKTKDILRQNFIWKFDRECETILENFYKGEVDHCNSDLSTLFTNEKEYENRGFFEAVVFNHVKPHYNLEQLYDNPHFCNSFLEFHQDKYEEAEKERLHIQRENYNKTKNSGKIFDWKVKTFK